MSCQISPILSDTDCPKEGDYKRTQTVWAKVERVERGHEKGTIYLEGIATLHINEKIAKWVKPGIRIELKIAGDGSATMQQIE